MKPLPDFTDTDAMAAIGRRSALWSARNHALEELRDKFTSMQSAEFGQGLELLARQARMACERLENVAVMWEQIEAGNRNGSA